MKNKFENKLITFLLIVIPIITINLIISSILYNQEKTETFATLESIEKKEVKIVKKFINQDFQIIFTDLLILSESQSMKKYLAYNNQSLLKNLSEKFYIVSKTRRIYDQIRYIDKSGMEICRINFNNGNPKIVSQKKLQNKRTRYYFN